MTYRKIKANIELNDELVVHFYPACPQQTTKCFARTLKTYQAGLYPNIFKGKHFIFFVYFQFILLEFSEILNIGGRSNFRAAL